MYERRMVLQTPNNENHSNTVQVDSSNGLQLPASEQDIMIKVCGFWQDVVVPCAAFLK